jgi:hypothetical protein
MAAARPGRAATGGGGAGLIAVVAASLALLGLVDGACAGFRSSVGRTGLIRHRTSDRRAARRGAGLAAVLLAPAVLVACGGALADHSQAEVFRRAGELMLEVYAPYGLVVIVALVAYATLGWRERYLASAAILGPLTLLRPAIAILGAGLAVGVTRDLAVALSVILAVLAVLTVEPVADRLWYGRRAVYRRERTSGSAQSP